MNAHQIGVLYGVGIVLILLDGWLMHVHWLALIGFVFTVYAISKIGDNNGN
jgi:uncharacterized membrane protein